MALYPEQVIREVGHSNDIVELVSNYVRLKRSGSGMVGLCPFHKEKTPSFHVSPDRQLFYCFGCGTGGTVFDFVMRAENLDFVDTVKFLAERSGISLPEPGADNSRQAEIFSRKQRILEINVLAARFFHDKLKDESSVVARKYVASRGLLPETVQKFGIGYAPDSWDSLTKYLKSKNVSEDEMLDAGLAVKNENKGTVYDKFRSRLMFPIIDVRGNVIAFGGRILDDGMPKYMNSPDTLVFNKSFNLFALNFAKAVNKQKGLILAEGYMDVISMHQSGITESVATLGTSLTQEQAKLIKKYSNEVFICYDSDEAGQKATIRAGDILTSCGNKVKVISVEGAKDPDELIKNKGVQSFMKCINDAKPYVKYRIDTLRERYNLKEVGDKVEFTNQASEILAAVENPIERDAYLKELAMETGISPDALNAQVKKMIYQGTQKETVKVLREVQSKATATDSHIKNNAQASKGSEKRLERSEKMLLSLMAKNKNVCKAVRDGMQDYEFSNPGLARLSDSIMKGWDEDGTVDTYSILSATPSEEVSYITSVFYENQQFEDEMQAAADLISAILAEKKKITINRLIEEGNVFELNKLLKNQ